MYIGSVSVTGTMNIGVLEFWRLLFLLPLPGLPLAGPATGWKSEKIAFLWGWHGVLAFDEATL